MIAKVELKKVFGKRTVSKIIVAVHSFGCIFLVQNNYIVVLYAVPIYRSRN